MKKTLKMSLLGMASVATLAAPVALAVSCGGSSVDLKPVTAQGVRVVTDGGSIDDKSFNEQAWDALKVISGNNNPDQSTHQIKPSPYGDSAAIVNGYKTYSSQADVNTILAPGFNHVAAMEKFIKDYGTGKLNFILVDGEVKQPNVASIIFKTDQAAFLAGNLAARYLVEVKEDTDPTVGTFGGGPFPGVTDFMKGFVEGIAYYNHVNATTADGRKIEFATFDADSAYTNTGFTQGGGSASVTKLLSEGADVILPVAGPQTKDVIDAIGQGGHSDVKIIGVDTNQATMYPGHEDKFLTSITKEVKTAFVNVFNVIDGVDSTSAQDDSFKGLGHTTVGDLDNHLVGIAEPSFIATSPTDGTKTIAAIYTEIEENTTLLTAAKATPKFSTWTQALAYLKGGVNPYGAE